MTMRIAIYTRVSTTDKGQTVENQERALRDACRLRGWTVVLEESDTISGTKQFRPGLDRIFSTAAEKQFDLLLVWSLDRLTREGAFRALEIIQQLSKMDIGFHSLQEPHFDTSGPFKDAIIAIAATLAKLERERIVERVKTGLERTKAQGTVLGPPRIKEHIAPRVIELHNRGWRVARIASTIKFKTKSGKIRSPSPATVRAILNERKVAA